MLKHYCGNDPARFRLIKARFSSHVFPGETVVTDMWADGSAPGRVLFQCRVVERGTVVITNGVAEVDAAAAPKL